MQTLLMVLSSDKPAVATAEKQLSKFQLAASLQQLYLLVSNHVKNCEHLVFL